MAEQDIRNSAFYKDLITLSKEQGYVTLLDIISAIKKHKETYGDIDAIIEMLKDDGVQYTEAEDGEPDFSEEPSEEDLENFGEDDFSDEIEDDETEVDGPTDEDLADIESEEDEEEKPRRSGDEDEDEDEESEVEDEEEESLSEWKGTDDDTEVSTERFIDISSVSEHQSEHKSHSSQNRFDTSQDDPIRLYLKEIGNENLLTGEQEVELAMQMENGGDIVRSVIRESGILITFFAHVIDKMNTRIEEDTEEKPHGISFSNEEKSLNVCIPSGASLIVKQGYINGYLDDSSNSLKKTTEWLFDWSYPVMSYICGLYGMTKFRNTLQSKEQCVNITSNCPDEYFVEISFAAGSEVYIVPSAIVAYSGSLKLKRHWRIFNAMAWCMGQISYFTLSGTGKCVIKGLGGIKINKTIDNELHKRKFRSILMATLNENMRVVRTETFFPYFSGKEELFDLQLQGNGVFISKNTVMEGENKTGITRLRDSFFAAIGKVLGF